MLGEYYGVSTPNCLTTVTTKGMLESQLPFLSVKEPTKLFLYFPNETKRLKQDAPLRKQKAKRIYLADETILYEAV